jgi:peroxiredoxin
MKTYLISLLLLVLTINHAIGQSKIAQAFELKNIDGRVISLNSFKNQKGIILTFVTNGCPVAELYQKRIQALHKKFSSQGFPVVAIDPVDNFTAMKDTATLRGYAYPFLYDSTQAIARKYNVQANTHTFVLLNTVEGFKIAYEGGIDDDYSGENVSKRYVEMAVTALLNGKSVKTIKTKVLGCPIEYR